MIRRLVEKEDMRFDEKRSGEGNTHMSSTTHVFIRVFHHVLGKAKTVKEGW